MEIDSNPWQILKKETTYENNWVKVIHHEVLKPNQEPGVYGVVDFKNIAVGIIPLDEFGYTWLVGQYRFPIQEYSWEIPEGGCLKGHEAPIDAARRELLEEVGLIAHNWSEMGTIHTSNSVCNEVGYYFLAENLTHVESSPEDTEILKIQRVHLKKAVEMVLNNEITDSISIAAILKVAKFKQLL